MPLRTSSAFTTPSSFFPSTRSIQQKCTRYAPLFRTDANFDQFQKTRSVTSETTILGELTNTLPMTGTDEKKIQFRPQHVKFSVPYEDLIIRSWEEKDRSACISVISEVLNEYGVPFDPHTADNDVLNVEGAYANGEFWVVEDTKTSTVVGTAGFYDAPNESPGTIEIRKLYLNKLFRGRGIGSFLLSALEQRALQMGHTTSIIETISSMKEANLLYDTKGYQPSSVSIDTKRCDIILEKQLCPIDLSLGEEFVEVVDSTAGWTVAHIPRTRAQKHRILFRAVAVLVESRGRIFVHTRSMNKSTYPGRTSAFVTGVVDYVENPLQAARREVEEELGLRNLEFLQPFEPFCPARPGSSGQRILFHPFVAEGDFSEEDISLNLSEVEKGEFMTREEITKTMIGGSLWREFCTRGSAATA